MMKYSEYRSKKGKGSAAFYIIIGCCLLAIGGASWFAASNLSKLNVPKNESNTDSSSDFISQITSIITEPTESITSAPAEKKVSDVPYSSNKNTESKVDKKPETVTFTMPVQGEITKNYNESELQYSSTYGDMRVHTGIDIACENGTSVSAAGNGTVLTVEENSALGTTVSIDHGNGITTRYSAISGTSLKPGDKLSAGDIIGTTATVPGECADQSHLHFEVLKNGHPSDPLSTLGLK